VEPLVRQVTGSGAMKPGRNDPCPCGSGRKYKHCCQPKESGKAGQANAAQLMQTALAQRNAGQLVQAEAACRQVLQIKPEHPDALNLLGLIAYQTGQNEQAVSFIRQAISANKRVADYYQNLVTILMALDRMAEAEDCLREMLIVLPSPDAHNNLGSILQKQGRMVDAIACYRRALELKPDNPTMWNNLGFALQSVGEAEEAIACFRRALKLSPDYCDAMLNLGNALLAKGLYAEAIGLYRRIIQIDPDSAMAQNNCGDALRRANRIADATECYRRAASLKPDDALIWNNLGTALQSQDAMEEAIACYQRALEFAPDYVEALFNLGNAFCDIYRYDDAITTFEKALHAQPKLAIAHNNLGHVLQKKGRLPEALANFKAALSIQPDLGEAWQNYLYCLNYGSEFSVQEIFEEHVKYGNWLEGAVSRPQDQRRKQRNPAKRLKVGYVSPDFRAHAVAYFIEPVLERHERAEIETYCYYNNSVADEVTRRLRSLAHNWRDIGEHSDEAAAELIRRDDIDILVDLAGHSAGNRLGVFARKPAPIQVTYLGYPATSGLRRMDYRLTDHYADRPVDADRYYTERLLRLPDSLWCYRPAANMPEISSLPALTSGYVTFGSFNNFGKVDRDTIDLWAKLLRAVPSARLKMLTVPEGEARQRLIHSFEELGIAARRLQFVGRLPAGEYFRQILETDIALDPVFVNGGTTTCESIWMGVPVITLVGNRFLSRAGFSILSVTGLAEFAAATADDYIGIAVRLATDLPRLAAIRCGLRERMANSPLADAKRFTFNLERAYREIWVRWCSKSDGEGQ
jgi:predicted O-linked N-acetylglucosamine transferase (SPINDLY family)